MKKKLLALLLALVMALGLVGTAGAATHTVKAGDNLSKIAAEYLGDSSRWKEIYEANKDIISNPNAIYVGQTLTIPGTDEPATPDEPVKPTVTATPKVDKSTQPRIIITTDLEVDDMNGLMLSLMYATDYDLAGIVWTAGKFHFSGDGKGTTLGEFCEEIGGYEYSCEGGTAGFTVETLADLTEFRPVDPTFLTRLIDVFYRADYEYLSKNNPNYPTPDYLLSIAKVGNIQFEGDYREETEGSQLIYDVIMDDDMRPVYIQHWGGINTTVRALYSIYEDYHGTEQWDEVLAKVVAKVRISGNGEDNCRAFSKIDEMFPGLKASDWTGFGGVGNYFNATKLGKGCLPFIGTNETLNPYYQAEWLVDAFKFGHGQVMAQFHLMNDGQYIYGEPMHYQYGLKKYIDWSEGAELGWGDGASMFTRMDYDTYDWMCCQFGCNSFVDLGLRQGITNSDDRYKVALFEDLAARADWAVMDPKNCNHAPVLSADKLDITAKAGETVTLTGTAGDPDGDALSVSWWVPANAWTYGAATEESALTVEVNGTSAQFTVPADAVSGDRFVINMEVKDTNVERPMTRYLQFTVTVK